MFQRMFNGREFTAVIKTDSFPIPDIFLEMERLGVNREHMYNTFNMGIGFVLCVDEKDVYDILRELVSCGENAYEIGYITSGGEGICLK